MLYFDKFKVIFRKTSKNNLICTPLNSATRLIHCLYLTLAIKYNLSNCNISQSMPDKRLQAARLLCEKREVRFTPAREQVFMLLAQAPGALGAYDLLQQLQLADPKAKPPTIYRALEFLIEQGFVHKVESENAFVLCNHFTELHPAQLLICDTCGDIQEIDPTPIEKKIDQVAAEYGFKVQHPTIELHGCCKKCFSLEAANPPCEHE
jgi:Fur family zinc uptake transcriptional regulator